MNLEDLKKEHNTVCPIRLLLILAFNAYGHGLEHGTKDREELNIYAYDISTTMLERSHQESGERERITKVNYAHPTGKSDQARIGCLPVIGCFVFVVVSSEFLVKCLPLR